jgi:hypothetical protein
LSVERASISCRPSVSCSPIAGRASYPARHTRAGNASKVARPTLGCCRAWSRFGALRVRVSIGPPTVSRCTPPHTSADVLFAIFLDKNRRGIGKSQSKWAAACKWCGDNYEECSNNKSFDSAQTNTRTHARTQRQTGAPSEGATTHHHTHPRRSPPGEPCTAGRPQARPRPWQYMGRWSGRHLPAP